MLVISRKDNEGVIIAKRIHVRVAMQLTDSVVLEINAPKSTRIEWHGKRGRMKASPTKEGHDFYIVLFPHDSLLINRQTSVTLVEIKQEKARLGFIAPKHISVFRTEVAKEGDPKKE